MRVHGVYYFPHEFKDVKQVFKAVFWSYETQSKSPSSLLRAACGKKNVWNKPNAREGCKLRHACHLGWSECTENIQSGHKSVNMNVKSMWNLYNCDILG